MDSSFKALLLAEASERGVSISPCTHVTYMRSANDYHMFFGFRVFMLLGRRALFLPALQEYQCVVLLVAEPQYHGYM